MPKERNKADGYREKAYEGDTKAISLLNHLNIETERTKAVVAADHRTHWILHPAIVEVPLTSGQRLYKLPHG